MLYTAILHEIKIMFVMSYYTASFIEGRRTDMATSQRHHVGGLWIFVNVGYLNDDI